ncbi:MAG: TauD/TfdA family dioxygenase [bacterium]
MTTPYRSLRRQTFHYLARPHQSIPRAPLDLPSAWRGAELRGRSDWIDRLARAEIDECRRAVTAALATGKPLTAMLAADFPLERLAARIAAWRRELAHGRGFVLIRDVPVRDWSAAESECFFWCLGLHLGIPGAQNPRGDLLGHVRDEHKGGDIRLYETNQNIAFHCDAADVVGLLCLHAAWRGGASRIASSVTVFNELLRRSPARSERLFRPFHLDTHGEGNVRSVPVPPCRYAGGELRTFWHSDYFRSAERVPGVPALTDDERALLDAYDAIAADPAIHLDMELEPGDIQLLSNHTQIHARTAYQDWPEPERRRHLLRLWLSLPGSRDFRLRWSTMRSGVELLQHLVAARLGR